MLLLLSPAFAGESTLLVGFSQPGDVDNIAAHGGTVRGCYTAARFCVIDYPTGDLPYAALQQTSGVRYVERDALIPDAQQALPADASGTADCTDLWELSGIGAETAWGTARGSDAPVVAIADGGFLTSHEEIEDRISGQYDYGNGDPYAEVEWSVSIPAHGTFIGAIIAGNGDNGAGRVGIVPEGRLNLLKIADSSGAFYFSYAASALADIAEGDLGIRVVNYSIASSSSSSAFQDAVASLADADILMVAAAGNCGSANCSDADNDSNPLYPASYTYEHVVSVAGSTEGGGFNTYSHYGASSVDLAAPGVNICSAGVTDDSSYYSAGGTSYAAPLVAGVAALLLEAHPDLTTTDLARVLRASAVEEEEWLDRVRADGVVSAANALATAVPRLEVPGTDTIDGTDTFDLILTNLAAEGTGHLLLTHGEGFSVTDADDWSITAFSTGDVITLPDAGEVTMAGSGTLLTGPLDAHRTFGLPLTLAGRQEGSWPVTVRLVASSAGANYLNAPYRDGEADETGFLAYAATIEVTAVAKEVDTGTPDTDAPWGEDSGQEDSGPAAEDSGSPPPGEEEEPVSGCACSSSTPAAGWWALVGLVGLVRRVPDRRAPRSWPPQSR